MASNTGAPKLTPAMPKQHLKTLTDSELWAVVQDKDYTASYRQLADDERAERAHDME